MYWFHLYIHFLVFSFQVCLAIAHYSHPADLQLLFGFEYQGQRYYESKGTLIRCLLVFTAGSETSTPRLCVGALFNGSTGQGGPQTPSFDRPSDWDREIKRTGASEWRVCSINENYAISPRLVAPLGGCGQSDACWDFHRLPHKSAITSLFWQDGNLLHTAGDFRENLCERLGATCTSALHNSCYSSAALSRSDEASVHSLKCALIRS